MRPVIVALVRHQCLKTLQVPLTQKRSDLGVMLAGGGQMEVEDILCPSIHQERGLKRSDLELNPLGVVATGRGAIPTGGIQSGDLISQEGAEPSEHPPDRQPQPREGLLHRGEVRQALEAQGPSDTRHLLKPIDQLPVGGVELDLQAIEHRQLQLGKSMLGLEE